MRIFFLAILIFCTATAVEDDYKAYINKGDSNYEKFNNLKAVEYYEKAYKLKQDNYEVLLKLTRAYNDYGEELKEERNRDRAKIYITKGLELAEKFAKLYPDSAAAYAYLALSYGNVAMFRGGEEKIKLAHKVKNNAEKAIQMDKNDYLPYIVLGIYNREVANLNWFERLFANTFFGKVPDGSFEESIRLFNEALKIDKNMIVPIYQKSKTYRYMGETKKEAELLKKVLKMPNRNFRDKFAKEKAERILARLSE